MNKLTFRQLDDRDIELLTLWLNKEHVLKWFQDTEDWLNEIKGRNDEYSWINHFIVSHNDKDIGFCQYYDCYNSNELENWYEAKKPKHTFSIDYLVGDERYLGKGFGKEIVKMLTDIIKINEKSYRIIVQPDKDNHASNGVLIANGYIYNEKLECYFKELK